MTKFWRDAAALFLCGAAAMVQAQAQAWPSKPVRWIVPFPPGGASDVVARIVGEKLTGVWGQPVVLENRPGAGGTIATSELVRSNDGHTLMIGSVGTHGVAPNLYRGLPYDPVKDVVPVTMLVSTPMVLLASPMLPVKNVGELVTLARGAPDKYMIASPGNGTFNHLLAEMLKTQARLSMEHVPYKGSVAAYPDLISGRTALLFDPIVGALPQIQQGNLKPLAISQRSAQLPNVPTFAEAGYPQLDIGLWMGLFAPANLPPAVLQKVSADVVAVLKSPEVTQKIEALASQVVAMPQPEFAKTYQTELARWRKAVTDFGVKIE